MQLVKKIKGLYDSVIMQTFYFMEGYDFFIVEKQDVVKFLFFKKRAINKMCIFNT